MDGFDNNVSVEGVKLIKAVICQIGDFLFLLTLYR